MDTNKIAKDAQKSLKDHDMWDDRAPFEAFASAHGLLFLGAGSTRSAFLMTDGNVLKVLHNPNSDYLYQTKSEIALWQKIKGTTEEKFVMPLLDWDKSENPVWEIMPFGKYASTDDMWAFSDTLSDEVCPNVCYEECGQSNVAWYDGRVVFVDYGFYGGNT